MIEKIHNVKILLWAQKLFLCDPEIQGHLFFYPGHCHISSHKDSSTTLSNWFTPLLGFCSLLLWPRVFWLNFLLSGSLPTCCSVCLEHSILRSLGWANLVWNSGLSWYIISPEVYWYASSMTPQHLELLWLGGMMFCMGTDGEVTPIDWEIVVFREQWGWDISWEATTLPHFWRK